MRSEYIYAKNFFSTESNSKRRCDIWQEDSFWQIKCKILFCCLQIGLYGVFKRVSELKFFVDKIADLVKYCVLKPAFILSVAKTKTNSSWMKLEQYDVCQIYK